MLEQLLKRVSHGSDSSAFESSTQFGSVLILAQALQHCHVNCVSVLEATVCSSGLLHPCVEMPFNNLGITKSVFNLFIPQAVRLLGVRRELSLLRLL